MDVLPVQDNAGARSALPEVWADSAGGLILFEDDPGVPTDKLHDPFAGLSLSVRTAVLLESKAIGSAQLSANVLSRDVPLRAGSPTIQRFRMREAAANSARAIKRARTAAHSQLVPILTALLRSQAPLREVQEASAAVWRDAYQRVRDVGRSASGLSRLGADTAIFREEETWFRGAVREELSYWNTFLAEVNSGRGDRTSPLIVSEERAWQRFGAYLNALRFMYESARIQAMPDNVLLYWWGPEDERNCPGCVYMMERSPFTKDNIPSVPRDGMTNCLTHCRHRIVVRVPALREDVFRRRNELPKRTVMVKQLKEIRNERSRRRAMQIARNVPTDQPANQRGPRRTVQASTRARNPFRGRPITGPPQPQPFTYRGRRVRVTRQGRVQEAVGESLEETLDQPAKYRLWYDERADDFVATWKIGDKSYRFWTKCDGHGAKCEVAFGSWGEYDLRYAATGEGDAFKVFATVGAIIRDLLKQSPEIDTVYFTSSGKSRSRLYDRLSKLMARKLDMKLTTQAGRRGKVYSLSREPQVVWAEAANTKATGDIDSGARGKAFEAAFVKGLKLLGLNFTPNRATGAVWDIRPVGAGWHQLVKDRDVNLKVHSTRWLFSDSATYKAAVKAQAMVKRGTITPAQADRRVENKLREMLKSKGAAATSFMKPRNGDIQGAIVKAANAGNAESLKELLKSKNFATKRLGRGYRVSVDIAWESDNWRATGFIRIDGGVGKKSMGVTGRARKLGGVWTFAFRDRSGTAARPHHAARTKVKAEGMDEELGWASLGIPRWDMPQIPSPQVPSFLMWLDEQGIKNKRQMIPANRLHPTQSEFNFDKIAKYAAQQSKSRLHMRKPVLVSSDYYVLDGHHRWAEALRADPRGRVNCIVIDRRIVKLVELARMFPGQGVRKGVDPRESGVHDDEALYDPGLSQAVKRRGFDDVPSARAAAKAQRDIKRARKLSKRIRRKLVGEPLNKRGKELLTDQLGMLESLTEAVPVSFDTIPYSSMRIQDVARLFDGASRAKTLDVGTLIKIFNRLIGALEFSMMAAVGRPEANRASKLIRSALDRLASRMTLRESVTLREPMSLVESML